MKMFDFRRSGCIATFKGKSDGVRSVQFSPFDYFNFASSFDNGTVEIWDYRKPESCVYQIIAHKGSVYTLDWHPDAKERQRLATGGRDSMIKIWDIVDASFQEVGCIQTNASVSCVKWRTNRKEQIGSAAMMLDHSVNVWDTRRPYVPFALFQDHEDITTGIEWKKSDENMVFSCSKDGTLYLHSMKDAYRPAEHVNPHGLGYSCMGFVGQAQSDYFADGFIGYEKKTKTVQRSEKEIHNANASLKRNARITRFLNPQCSLTVFSTNKSSPQHPTESLKRFKEVAIKYVLKGREFSFEEICEHNAKVAESCQLSCDVPMLWRIMAVLFKNVATQHRDEYTKTSNVFKKSLNSKEDRFIPVKQDSREHIYANTGESNGEESEPQSEMELESYLTDITKGNGTSEFECFYSEEDDTDDVGLRQEDMPIEAFQQRKVMDQEHTNSFSSRVDSPLLSGNEEVETSDNNGSLAFLENKKKQEIDNRRRRRNSRRNVSISAAGNAVTSSSPPSDVEGSDVVVTIKPLQIPFIAVDFKLQTIFSTLERLAENGDIQTAVCCQIVLTNKLNYCPLDDAVIQFWQLQYLELLNHLKLWNQYTEVINFSSVANIRNLNSSSLMQTCCGYCNRRFTSATPWQCEKHSETDHRSVGVNNGVRCSYCHSIVKDLYTWCRGCHHGGHSSCLREWFSLPESEHECPTGCGHKCNL